MKRLPWLSTVSAIALLLVFAGVSAAFGQATVSTDKLNYQPGEYVLISGDGWAPGETVSLTIVSDDATVPHAGYEATADPEGRIVNRDHLVTSADTNHSFRIDANGHTSGATAQAVFADGPLILSVSASGQTPSSTVAGHVALYTTTAYALKVFGLFCSGAVASMSITGGIPNGVSYVFNPRQPTASGSSCTATSALTIYTSAYTPPGVYNLTVDAANSSTDHATTTITLTVSPENVPPVPDASYLPTITGQCYAQVTTTPTATDNVSGRVWGTTADPLNYYDEGTYTVHWTYTDGAGNKSYQNQAVIVHDTTPPEISSLPSLYFATGAEATTCGRVILPTELPRPYTYDNCGGQITLVPFALPADNLYPVGITYIGWRATDRHGNSTERSQQIMLYDNAPPVLHAPSALHVTTGPDATLCGRKLDDAALGVATAEDNCAGAVTLLHDGVPADQVFPVGTTTITWTAIDATGNRTTATQDVTVADDTPPVLVCPSNFDVLTDPGTCSAVVRYLPEAWDNCAGATLECTPASGSIFPLGTSTVQVTGTDAAGNRATASFLVQVGNPPPAVTIQGPPSSTVCPIGGTVTLTGAFTDNPGDVHTAQWMLDGAALAGTVNEAAGTVRGSITPRTPGIYKVSLTVTDVCGGSGTASTVAGMPVMVIVYDPNGGFVTGGGWIQSPAGAFALDPARIGKANFGFTSKYRKSAMAPSGETEFQFSAGDLDFHSTSYDWLVINGPQARYKGSGTINGAGAYSFTLTALDGDFAGGGPDRFRIAIKDLATNTFVYDNQPGADELEAPTTSLAGGSIVIHPGASASGPSLLPQSAAGAATPSADGSLPLVFGLEPNHPNPFTASTGVQFTLAERGHVRMVVYDVAGREVARLVDEDRAPGRYGAEWSGRDAAGSAVRPGVYFCRITVFPTSGSPAFTAMRKMVMAK